MSSEYRYFKVLGGVAKEVIDAFIAKRTGSVESRCAFAKPGRGDCEQHLMELAAISTATIQNTEATIKDRISSDNPFCTQAYLDVCKAVDREMSLIESVKRLTNTIRFFASAIRCGESWSPACQREYDAAVERNSVPRYHNVETSTAYKVDSLEVQQSTLTLLLRLQEPNTNQVDKLRLLQTTLDAMKIQL